MASPAREHRDAVHQFIDWVFAFAPCDFAPMFAKPVHGAPARMHFVVPRENLDVEQLDQLADIAGSEGKFAAVLWPRIRTPLELLRDGVLPLVSSSRWRVQQVAWGDEHARPQDVLLGVSWQTSTGEWSSVMGFAPHGSMPVSRRSPYAAMVWWPGARKNDFNRKPGPGIGFIDADHQLADEEQFKEVRRRSTHRTEKSLEHAPEDFKRFREVAFCLPKEDALAMLPQLERRQATASEQVWIDAATLRDQLR